MSEERKYRWIGTRPIRHDGVDKVTGRANFGADLHLPGMLHGRVLRSPHAHAKIVSIDVTPALAVEGVKAVITGADLPELPSQEGSTGEADFDFRDLSHNILARDKVFYDGHAVAAVAAISTAIAREALDHIAVEYEVLPHVLEVDDAMAPGAPILHADMRTKGLDPPSDQPTNVAERSEFGHGDPDQGFPDADVIVEREFSTKTVHQGYIEPHAVVARTGEDGQSVVWCCTQGPFMVRAYSAKVLGLDVSQVKVIPSEIGGGFGGKTTVYEEPLAILLSRKTGRPVKMVMDRSEVFRATGPTSGSRMRVKIGAKRDGTFVACDASLYYDAGAYPGSPVKPGGMTIFAPYDVPHARVECFDVVVNKPKVAAYRAPGAPIAAFAAESVIDELARELGMDPIDLRMKNASKEGTKAVYGPKFRRIGFEEVLRAVKEHPHYKAPLEPGQGRGVAAGFWFNGGMQSSASVHINEDGTASVVSGCPDIGGSRTSLALMAAEVLQIPVEHVRPSVADTESIGYNDTTGGSRVTFATGMAVIDASEQIVQQLRERAAKFWDIDPESVTWEDGRAIPTNGASDLEPLSIAELAKRAARTGGPIAGRASLTARGVGPSFAAHICDVAVDQETGRVEIKRYTAVQDAGKAIHPGYVEGQLQGGAVQGIGWALNEEYIYDDQGRLENPGFLDYRMPVASDVPMIDTVIVEVANPMHPFGVRGVGETPIVPPLAAVANAVRDATGVTMRDLPLSPPRVLEALDARD
jgi:CO/xanthine dehydrogenase Mo-binding subunit